MPKPIPPPPPQPSAEETTIAVRWVRSLMLVTCALFFGLSQCYHQDAMMLDYGRDDSMDWIIWRAENLDMESKRAHNNGEGKIIWMIGSSILRESFDEKWLNDQLEINNSKYRIIKLSMNRGNAGISFGFLKNIELQKDDIVIHNVSMNNFKKDWLEFSTYASSDLMRLLDQKDFWELEEWGVADKLEQASAIPPNFWRYHGTYMDGLTKWFTYGITLDKPRKSRAKHHLTHRRTEFEKNIRTDIESKYYTAKDGFDFSEKQFNIHGLTKMESICNEHDVRFILFYIPPRQQYLAEMVHQESREEYEKFLENLDYDLYYLPQLPENDYYDLTHPNFRGRKSHNEYFLDWVTNPQHGKFPDVTWEIPEYNKQ